MRRFTAVLTAGLLGIGFLAGCSSDKSSDTTVAAVADTTVSAGDGLTVPATAEGTPVAVEVGETSDTEMFMKLDTATVPAGKVTFTLTNNGKKAHEMVVLKTDEPFDQLVVTADKVSEDTTQGEIGETAAGAVATVTLDLPAGNYVLVCNIEKHYAMGMRAAFTVTP